MMNYNHEETLIMKCSQEDFEKLQKLFGKDELSEMLGVKVIDMGISIMDTPVETIVLKESKKEYIKQDQKPIILNQWLKGIIEPDWELIKPNNNFALAVRNSSLSVSCRKSYNFGIDIDNNSVELTVKIEPTEDGKMQIELKVSPSNNLCSLPEGLRLILLVDSDIKKVAEAKNADSWLRIKLKGEVGDNFSVKIASGDFSVTEDFVITS